MGRTQQRDNNAKNIYPRNDRTREITSQEIDPQWYILTHLAAGSWTQEFVRKSPLSHENGQNVAPPVRLERTT